MRTFICLDHYISMIAMDILGYDGSCGGVHDVWCSTQHCCLFLLILAMQLAVLVSLPLQTPCRATCHIAEYQEKVAR